MNHRKLARTDRSTSFITSRRRFLVGIGGGLASVVLVNACSSGEPADGASTDPTGSEATGDTTTSVAASAEPTEQAGAAGSDLVWEEVSFGFVSAYLLQRGSEVTIVDTGTGTTEEFETGLSSLGASWSNVANVILTHAHGDHVGGLDAVLTNAPTATAYAGTGDLAAIDASGFDAGRITGVADGDEVFGLEVVATPGHTPGHIVVFDRASGLLVAGDAINTSGGVVTGPNPDFTPDMATAEASVARLIENRSVSTALVGHGAPVEGSAGDSLAELVASLG